MICGAIEHDIELAWVGRTINAALVQAVAQRDPTATEAAIKALLHHHIVRLRVLDASGQVLADIGGPYVIAVEVPIQMLTSDGTVPTNTANADAHIGVWASTHRQIQDMVAIKVPNDHGLWEGGRRIHHLRPKCSISIAQQDRHRAVDGIHYS